MKRAVVCLLACVLLLHACGSAPREIKITTTTLTENAVFTENTETQTVEQLRTAYETETAEYTEQTALPSEPTATTHASETAATTYAPKTTAKPAPTSVSATQKKDWLLKTPEHVSQTASSAKETTATTKTTTTKPTSAKPTAATTTTFSGGSLTPNSSPVQSPSGQTTSTKPTPTSEKTLHTCTLTISCKEIRDRPEKLKKEEKLAFVPDDGYILKDLSVTFTEGETVYDVLRRACETHPCKANCKFCAADGGKIQMESAYTPVYDSYYVEGIHQLYEKDCGGTSGWTYYVNGYFPNYGSSQYTLHDGDKIEWVYSIELDEFE